ncbi:hypothetical protein [Candidatus Uabimicrobium sp. HlEnr_7]|uniref:hypothetical protein n=1 Tax=Candidatus Uabimicrobium helgolandensis TaxID=3095367 RepID=UPI003557C0F6
MEHLFFVLSAFEISDNVSFMLSIFGSIVALVSLYYSRFKIGRLKALPLKMYVAQPLNSKDIRLVKLVLPVTFINNGAVTRAVNDMRIRVVVPGENDLVLDWIYEYKEVSLLQDIGIGNFPAQPTIKPYESVNRIYGFQSDNKGGSSVAAMEKHEEAQKHLAYLEYYSEKRKWRVLNQFCLIYNGRRKWEMDYDNINCSV